MKRKFTMKLELPPNFQETIIIQELNFSNGEKNIKIIRNLIESYTVISIL